MGWNRRQFEKGNKKKIVNKRQQQQPIPFPIPIPKEKRKAG